MRMGPLAVVALLLLFGLTACDSGPSDASGTTAADAASAAVRALPAVEVEATYTPGKFGSSDPSPMLRATITADSTVTRDQLLSVLRTFGQ